MTSERQIAANRRNAEKSTGPRTKTGKQRIRRNAYRHGLAARPIRSAVAAKQVERLARKIAGIGTSTFTLELARSAAEAMLDLARVRQTKVALLERVALSSAGQIQKTASENQIPFITAALSAQDLEQESLAILRNLPELRVIERYERRISSRRDRAIRQVNKRR